MKNANDILAAISKLSDKHVLKAAPENLKSLVQTGLWLMLRTAEK